MQKQGFFRDIRMNKAIAAFNLPPLLPGRHLKKDIIIFSSVNEVSPIERLEELDYTPLQ